MKLHDTTNEQVTLRDQFAMAALTGMTANPSTRAYMERVSIEQTDAEMFADYAYEYADAMLAAREKK